MKTTLTIGATTLALTLVTSLALAKPPQGGPPPGGQQGKQQSGEKGNRGGGGEGRPPKASPIMVALDADKDGVISATEITNASTALATLDANGDGQITKDEIRPPRPPRGGKGKSEE